MTPASQVGTETLDTTCRNSRAKFESSLRISLISSTFPMAVSQLLKLASVLLVLAILVGSSPRTVAAQELNCVVRVDYSKLSGGSDYGFLNEFQQRVEEHMNDQRWTDDDFREFEQIECQVQINFEEALSLTSFRAGIIVAARRPIYGTPQTTTVIQFSDTDWQFNYSQGTPLNMDKERYDPITSVLDFYAYLILGYDYDTFSELGGTPYFERARRIAERAQVQNAPGWSVIGSDRGRVTLITQLLDPTFKPLRSSYYAYHFGALDRFTRDPDAARQTVYEQLEILRELYDQLGRRYAIDVFFNAKYSELTAIFLQSRLSNQAFGLLTNLDSAHMTEYNKLTTQ